MGNYSRTGHGTDGSLHTLTSSSPRPYKSTLPFAASAAGFVTFSKSNAKALLTAEPSKAHLRPTGWSGALPRCLRAAPQQGRPLKRAPCTPPKHCPVSVVTMVTVFLIPAPLPKTSSRPSPSSRFGVLQCQCDPSPGVAATAFIADTVLV